MMKLFYTYIKDSIRYAVADKKAIVLFGTLLVINSIILKNEFISPIWYAFNITLIFAIGYCSFISWYTLKGSDKHPDIRNYRRLFKEGVKKAIIIIIYVSVLAFAGGNAKKSFDSGSIAVGILFAVLFVVVYLFFVAGLLNRYLYRGKFLKAFDFPEIIRLFSIFDLKSFIKVMLAVVISQIFTGSIILPFDNGFSLFELVYSISIFFLAPFFLFATKRLVGLNVYHLLEKSNLKREEISKTDKTLNE